MMRHSDDTRQRLHERTLDDERYLATCLHEAGHAVLTELLAPGSCDGITLQRSAGGSWDGDTATHAETGSRAMALVCMAGKAAEEIYNQESADERRREFMRGERPGSYAAVRAATSPSDDAGIDAYLQARGYRAHESKKRERRRLYGEALAAVRQNWRTIVNVADALIGASEMGGAAILSGANVRRAMRGEPVAARKAATQAKRDTAQRGRPLTLAEMIEIRDQAQKRGQTVLYRAIGNSIELRQGRSGGGDVETAALYQSDTGGVWRNR